jgi:hypothetical protein
MEWACHSTAQGFGWPSAYPIGGGNYRTQWRGDCDVSSAGTAYNIPSAWTITTWISAADFECTRAAFIYEHSGSAYYQESCGLSSNAWCNPYAGAPDPWTASPDGTPAICQSLSSSTPQFTTCGNADISAQRLVANKLAGDLTVDASGPNCFPAAGDLVVSEW